MIVSSATIITQVQKLGALSSNQAGFTNADFLTIANSIVENVTAEVLAAREEYLIYSDTLPVTAGQDTYRVPSRSIGGEIRHLWFEDGAGNRTELDLMYQENLASFNATQRGMPTAFYVQGNSIVLLPIPNISGSLVVRYPFRPSLLVDTSTTQTVATVASNSITVPFVPSNFVSGATFDIVDHLSGNLCLYHDLVGTISGTTITFNQPIPNAAIGNYVAQAGQTPVVMLPEELHVLVLEETVLRIETLRGSKERINAQSAVVQRKRDAAQIFLTSRVVSKPHAAGGGNPLLPRRRF